MKACFILQRRFAYVGNAIALALKEKGVAKFCGYVYIRNNLKFLKNQKQINYTSLLLDEDLHSQYKKESVDLNYLKQLEKDYGLPNLWPYLELDRVIRRNQLVREYPYDKPKYSHEEMLQIMQVKTKGILKFLNSEKPDFVIMSVIADLSTLFFYQAAKKMGIKVFFLESSRVRNLHTLTENYKNFSYIEEVFSKLQKKELQLPENKLQAELFLNEFRNNPITHSHQDTPDIKPVTKKRQFLFLRPDKTFLSLKFFIKNLIGYFLNQYRNDPYVIKPWHYAIDRFKRKMRVLIGFKDLYDNPNYSENYAFFPLQLQPEMATSLFSKFYTDQLWLITQIARALPVGYKIYIKEHPAMYGYRTRSFYKEIKKIPNAKLISPTESGFKLIQNSKIIFTLTGSSGWEGVMLKKPIITFGDVFYNALPMSKKCDSINDLPIIIQNQLENFNYDEKSLINFLTAVFKESADIDLITMWEVESGTQIEKYKDQINSLADLIITKINLKKAEISYDK